MIQIFSALVLISGGLFCLLAAVGMVRLPDTIIRMHAATKAGTLGSGLIVVSMMATHGELAVSIRALAVVFFLLLTAPVATHLIGRAAYRSGVRLWEKTRIDELEAVCRKPDTVDRGET